MILVIYYFKHIDIFCGLCDLLLRTSNEIGLSTIIHPQLQQTFFLFNLPPTCLNRTSVSPPIFPSFPHITQSNFKGYHLVSEIKIYLLDIFISIKIQ